MRETTACSGCGVVLPRAARVAEPLGTGSAECAGLFAEVAGFEFEHPVMLRYHQLSVDSYGAQHADGAPHIRVGYALAGLWLALEHGFTGDDVRAVHQRMGKPADSWPTFRAPARPAWSTVLEVADQGVRRRSETGHAHAVQAWAADVWSAWLSAEPTTAEDVRTLLRACFPASAVRALSGMNGPSGAIRRLTTLLAG